MKITSATFPPHIARAYGVHGAAPVQPVAKITRSADAQRTGSIAKIAPATASPNTQRAGSIDRPIDRLVARVVPGSVTFTDDGTAKPSAPALPIYTHPADRHAAATGIAVGTSLDISG